MSSVPCSRSIRFLYWFFSLIDVDTLLAMDVDCLRPHSDGGLHRNVCSRSWRLPADERGQSGDSALGTLSE
jgi:hypothetical protein